MLYYQFCVQELRHWCEISFHHDAYLQGPENGQDFRKSCMRWYTWNMENMQATWLKIRELSFVENKVPLSVDTNT